MNVYHRLVVADELHEYISPPSAGECIRIIARELKLHNIVLSRMTTVPPQWQVEPSWTPHNPFKNGYLLAVMRTRSGDTGYDFPYLAMEGEQPYITFSPVPPIALTDTAVQQILKEIDAANMN